MRRSALALSLALLVSPLALLPATVATAQEPVFKPNSQMQGVLPGGHGGW